jgi:hypothetical protein
LVPSAEDATESQLVLGALVCVQVWANEELTALNRPQKIITAGTRSSSVVLIYSTIGLRFCQVDF